MTSILKINSTEFKNRDSFQVKKQAANQITVERSSVSNDLLSNFLSLMGRNNFANISFGSGQESARPGWAYNNFRINVPQDGTWLNIETREAIQAEASKRINGEYSWPQIDTINAWMVSAETDNFMSIGGLAKVAVDLPNVFNKRFSGKKDKMAVVTPLYVDGKINKLETYGNKAKYSAKNAVITLDKVMDMDVDIFDEWVNGGEMKPRKVAVYKGVMETGTPYIMFYEPKIFNTIPDNNNEDARRKNENCSGCYVTNKFGFDENVRFAFFSKCVYEYAKRLKSDPKLGEKAPNVVIMNDWHVGSLAPLMKYLSQAEGEQQVISSAVQKYFQSTPTLFIAHNLGYQGSIHHDKNNYQIETLRTKVLGTLFGKYTKTIMEHSKNHDMLPDEDKNTLFKGTAVNAGMMGLALADRIVPVSVNYGEELLASSNIGKGMQNLLKIRDSHKTFAPITNGYSKTLVAPTKKNFDGWLSQVEKDLSVGTNYKIKTSDIALQPYTIRNMETARLENKRQIFKLLNRIIERERQMPEANWYSLDTADSKRRYMLFRPFETDLSDIEDITKVPVMTFVGRVADQKGMDTNFKNAILDFARDYTADANRPDELKKYKGWDVPVCIIGGTIAELSSYKALEALKCELAQINPKFAQRMLLFKGYANTNMLAVGTDFFLIPSNFEPCGLIQMEVMAKGVLPVATATGGLVSTIRDTYDGFLSTVFYDKKDEEIPYNPNTGRLVYVGANMKDIATTNWMGFEEAMKKALHTFYKLPNRLVRMQKTAMQKDFSWDSEGGALDKYIQLIKYGKTSQVERTTYFNIPDERKKTPFHDIKKVREPRKSKPVMVTNG